MAGSRETFILTQDIAPEQLIDVHPKLGTRLRKLVDKRVIDTTFFFGVVIPPAATSIRMDSLFLDAVPATGPTDLGYLIDRRHEIFQPGTDDAFVDIHGREVTTQIAITTPLNFQATLTTGLTTATTVGSPGDVEVGDYVRVTGQGTVATFFAQVLSKVPSGPNFILTFSNLFVQGITQVYTVERVTRWEVSFLDSTDAPYIMAGGTAELGFFQRVYLADVTESFGTGPIDYPELTPEAGGGVGPPGAPGSSVTLELLIDPGETFLWFHGLMDDIPVLTWWVEWPGYPAIRFYYGLQVSPGTFFEGQVDAVPTIDGTAPVQFQHIDGDSILITNKNTVQHRVKAVVFKPM
jgi:hypothetical protein